MGALGGVLHAVTTITFGVDHARLRRCDQPACPRSRALPIERPVCRKDGGTLTDSPPVGHLGRLTLPMLSGGRIGSWHSPDPLGWLEKHRWFLIADVAGLLRGMTRDISVETLICLSLLPIAGYVLWRTPFGLRLRSSGEKPSAADSLGVNIIRIRYAAVIASGGHRRSGRCLAGHQRREVSAGSGRSSRLSRARGIDLR